MFKNVTKINSRSLQMFNIATRTSSNTIILLAYSNLFDLNLSNWIKDEMP